MGERPLNDRQARFAHEYVVDLNGTQAAIRAGYSKRGADVTACRLLGDPRISRIVADLKAKQLDDAGASAQWLLERLMELANVDLADLLDAEGRVCELEAMPVGCKRLIAGLEVMEEYQGEGKKREFIGYTKKLRLVDRLRVLELIGKHIEVGAFSKVAAEGEGLVVLIRDYTGKGVSSGSTQANGKEEVQPRAGSGANGAGT